LPINRYGKKKVWDMAPETSQWEALSLGANARRSRVDTGDIVVAERNDMPKRAVAEEPGQKRM